MTNQMMQYTPQVIPILQRYQIAKAAFFGSLVDGKFQEGHSDVDILVMPPKGMSLLGFIALKQDIEDRIGKKVDLVSYNGLSPYLKESILNGQYVFYET